MKNADMPAMPVPCADESQYKGILKQGYPGVPIGLTKRELFAAMAMQGMLSHPLTASESDEGFGLVAKPVAIEAVLIADALLKALEDGDE